MTHDELRLLVVETQRLHSESDTLEVKAAHGGTPKRLRESLSAFANHTGGGVLLFGLDETKGFELVGVGDPHRLQEDLTGLASSEMEPALRPRFVVDEIEGKTVVAAEIDEIPAAQKPCFFKPGGLAKGAYIRVGNTNRHMTEYEVFGFLSGREQPNHDEDAIAEACLDDLDQEHVRGYLKELRRSRPAASFLAEPDERVLERLRIARMDCGTLKPTLAALLVFGKYPQEFLPQLVISFVQFFGVSEDERTPAGERFVDNRRFEGPIPEMMAAAESYVLGAMRKASLIEGLFRRDVPEYPLEALREVIANAVAHRDYSPYVRGSQIQIRLFADRLEIVSPGGLYGNVSVDNLEEEQSTRNTRLMRIMEDLHLVENRGSGIGAILSAMRQANLAPPRFDDRRSSFRVIFFNHTLMNPDAVAWLNQFSDLSLNDRQRLALVFLRQRSQITNSEYRRLNHVEPLLAGQELRGLVEQGLIQQQGIGRGTSYVLGVSADLPQQQLPLTEEDQILAHVREHGPITNAECRDLLDVDRTRAYYLLKKLCDSKKLKPKRKGRWSRYVLY